jgi:hypothetical protein
MAALGEPEYVDGPAVEQLHEAAVLYERRVRGRGATTRLAIEIERPLPSLAASIMEFAPS